MDKPLICIDSVFILAYILYVEQAPYSEVGRIYGLDWCKYISTETSYVL